MSADVQEVVLVLVLGTSPAILTETVWALAQQVPAVVPNRLEVWTTTKGRETFEAQVMATGVWKQLLETLKAQQIPIEGKLKFGEDSWKIFANDDLNRLEDLTTEADNLAAADKMLTELRKYTDNPMTQVHLSIAGGRKTMGALALQCLSLVGRPQDEVSHVLVNEPFDKRLVPPFFYPEKKGRNWVKRKWNEETVTDKAAQIRLFKVPYVRMRPLYEEKMGESVGTFAKLCDRIQAKIDRKPVLRINEKTWQVWRDDNLLKLNATEVAALLILIKRKISGFPLAKALCDVKIGLRNNKGVKPPHYHDFLDSSKFNDSTDEKEASHHISVVLNSCRKKGIPEGLLPLRGKKPDFSCVEIVFDDKR